MTNQDIDRRLTRLAERQHGLVSRDQAEALGLTRAAWRHRRRHGDWLALSDRVVRRAGAPPSDEQSALAAVLDVGDSTYTSHQSGAAFWGVPGFRVVPVQVMTLRATHGRTALGQVHHPLHLPDPFAAVIDGVPVVRPSLLVLQLAPLVHPAKLGTIFDNLWSRRLLSAPSVRRELEPVLGRGRPGTSAVRDLLDARPDDYTPPASNLEGRFLQIVRDHDLPRMRRQVDLGDDERWCGRVDFVAVDLPLVFEVDSGRYHGALTDTEADDRRQRRLEGAGYLVRRIPEFDIWHRPAAVAATVRDALWEIRRGDAA